MMDMIFKILQPEVLKVLFWSGLIFLILYQFLGRGVLSYFFSSVNERYERIAGDANRAAQLAEEADAMARQIESKLLEANLAAMKIRDSIVNAAKEEQDELLYSATQEHSKQLELARADIASIRNAALSDAVTQSTEVASRIVSRLISVESWKETPQ